MPVGAAVAAAAVITVPAHTTAQNGIDTGKEAVRQAALDYLEGIYNAQPERIERSLHPSPVKRGFYKKDASSS